MTVEDREREATSEIPAIEAPFSDSHAASKFKFTPPFDPKLIIFPRGTLCTHYNDTRKSHN